MNFRKVAEGPSVLTQIFPTKQKDVSRAVMIADEESSVEKMVVFGSAVTLRCGPESDIDLALFLPGASDEEYLRIAHRFFSELDSEVDVVRYDQIRNSALIDEIDRTGVVVYARI